jgi:hypothetical protein
MMIRRDPYVFHFFCVEPKGPARPFWILGVPPVELGDPGRDGGSSRGGWSLISCGGL